MDVRDLILDTNPTTFNESAPKRKRNTPKPPEWEVVLSDAIDGAIRRKTSKTSRLMVWLMSQGQFYIKDERTGDIEQLTGANMAKFLAGSDSSIKSPVPWCTGWIDATRKHADRFVELVANEDFQWMAKHGIKKVDYSDYSFPSWYGLKQERERLDSPLPKMVKKVCEEVIGQERVKALMNRSSVRNDTEVKAKGLLEGNQLDEIKFFESKFGLDWTRAYIRTYLNAPFVGYQLPNLDYYARNMFERYNFKPARFVEYLFGESVRQGYGKVDDNYYRRGADLDDFVRTWSDTLDMQVQTRGKVYDKYPDEIDSMHRKLSFKVRLMEIDIDETSFKEHSERLAKHAKQDAYFLIRPPFNKADMVDEASQQANCLASYIPTYAANKTDIYFLRRSIEPEKSHVTVEVRDGRIRQAYAACNCRPDDESLEWLAKWAEENGFEMVDADTQRPQAA